MFALGPVMVRIQEIEGNISISSLMENHSQFTLLLYPSLTTFVSRSRAIVGSNEIL